MLLEVEFVAFCHLFVHFKCAERGLGMLSGLQGFRFEFRCRLRWLESLLLFDQRGFSFADLLSVVSCRILARHRLGQLTARRTAKGSVLAIGVLGLFWRETS